MNKAYKYRIYPTEEQKTKINQNIGSARFIYNQMLGDKIAYYQVNKKMLDINPSSYKKDYPWLNDCDSLALANASQHLITAYKNFFKKKSKFPKFKSKKKCKWSYTTNNQGGNIRVVDSQIKLPKLGWIKIKYSRQIGGEATIKSVTVTRTRTNKYFVSILVRYENQILPTIPKKFVGLDYSMSNLFIDSNGNEPLQWQDYLSKLNKSYKKLAKANRRLAKKQKGSKNFQKQKLKVALANERIANQRLDYLHKLALYLVNNYDCVAIEDISVKQMAKKKKKKKFSFGKSVARNAWAMFVNILSYKLTWNSKTLVKIDKWFPSSQKCHECGTVSKITKDLSVRQWTCPQCGHTHNRDTNAAKNIRDEGMRLVK